MLFAISLAAGIIIGVLFFVILAIMCACRGEDSERSDRIDSYVIQEFWGNCHSILNDRYNRRDASFCDNCSGYKKCCEEAEAELIRKGLLEPRKEKKK